MNAQQIEAIKATRLAQLDVGGPAPVSSIRKAAPRKRRSLPATPQGVGQVLRRLSEAGFVENTTRGWKLTRTGLGAFRRIESGSLQPEK